MAIWISRPVEWFHSLGGRRRVALVTAGVAALFVGGALLSRTSLFDARRIEVSGSEHLRRAEVVEIAGVSRATNALWLDEGAAERRLEAEPWIAHADVSVSFPLSIQIAVTERTPVAVLDGIGGLIAGDGTSLGTWDWAGRLPRIDLGTVTAADGVPRSPVGAARTIGALPPNLRSNVTRVRVMLDGTLEVHLGGGAIVRFGSADDATSKVKAIRRVMAWASAKGTAIRTLSVVAPDAPAATLVR